MKDYEITMTRSAFAIATPSTGPEARPSHHPSPAPRDVGGPLPGGGYATQTGLAGEDGTRARARLASNGSLQREPVGHAGARTRTRVTAPSLWRAVAVFVFLLLGGLAAGGPAWAETTVPGDWALNPPPSGVPEGGKFRLIFATSNTRDATSSSISTYNTFVQTAAAAGHRAIRAYSSGFRVVGCTEDDDARDNTSTTHSSSDRGVPIYWLNGNKVADHYGDFYDGSWDDEANPKNESGNSRDLDSGIQHYPFTGCDHDGTEASGKALGETGSADVRRGRPNSSESGDGPIGSNGSTSKNNSRPFYALSQVFKRGPIPPNLRPKLVEASVQSSGERILLRFNKNLDRASNRRAEPSRFRIWLDGKALEVGNVTYPSSAPDSVLLRTFNLRGQSGSVKIHRGASVTVAYTDPTPDSDNTRVLQDDDGVDAASFTTGERGVPRVTNSSNADVSGTLPVIESASVSENGKQVTLTFNERLATGLRNKPAASRFRVGLPFQRRAYNIKGEVFGDRAYIDAEYTISGRTVTLNLHETTVYRDERVRMRYNPPPGDYAQHLRDRDDGNAVQGFEITATNHSTQDHPLPGWPPPEFNSAAVAADGRSIDLTFDEALDPDNLPAQFPSYFVSLRLDGKTLYAQDRAVPSDNPRIVRVSNFASERHYIRNTQTGKHRSPRPIAKIYRGQTVKVSYQDPSTPDDAYAIQDVDGNDVRTFRNRSVVNNSTVEPPATSAGIWSATLTVGTYSVIVAGQPHTVGYGFITVENVGMLSDTTFSSGGVDYTVVNLFRNTSGSQLTLRLNPTGMTALNSDSFALVVGDRTLSFSDAAFDSGTHSFKWTFPSGQYLSWSDGETVAVSLTEKLRAPDGDTALSRFEVNGEPVRVVKVEGRVQADLRPEYGHWADIEEDAESATIHVEPRDSRATIAYQNVRRERLCDASIDDGFQVNLKPGYLNRFFVKVAAANGTTTEEYWLSLTPFEDRHKVWGGPSVSTGCDAPMTEGASGLLTASLESAPARHDGSSQFNVRIRFSETLKNQALGTKVVSVSGGTHAGSTRIAGDDEIWEITVAPSGDDDVTLSLSSSESCGSGIACTVGLEPLSAAWSTTIPGLATETVTPLTASFADIPDEHDGAPFPVRIAFSETLKNQALGAKVVQVTGGTNRESQRVSTEDEIWQVTIAPAGNGPVTIELVSSETCGSGIACTEGDLRPLSTGISHTVQGPWLVSVADATAAEGATMDFAVSLSRPARFAITVNYATSNGTAMAGADYTAKSGSLRFTPGQQTKTVQVTILEDTHEDDDETFTLTLSNPSSGAVIEDGTATGTIENSDPMPQAWLARFGRTVAEQVLDAVEGRMRASRTAGVEMTLAGEALPSWRPGTGAGAGDTPTGSSALTMQPHESQAQHEAAGLAQWLGDETDPERQRRPDARAVSPRDLLTGSAFAFTGGGAQAGFYSLWGRAAVSRFDGREGELSLDGDVASGLLGADWSRDRIAAGLVIGHSRGEGGYRAVSGDGTVDSTLTGVYPWGRYALSERVSVWGVAGYGEGTLTLTPAGQSPIRADLDLALGAAGLRAVLLTAPAGGGFELAAKADALAVRTTTARVSGLGAADASVTRLRLGLEGSRAITFAGGATLTPSIEIGVRRDGGDAETGLGADLGGGLAWRDPARGLSADLRGRGLLSHEADGIRERGFSGSLGWEPAPADGHGPKLTLRQSAGASAAGGMDALLGRRTLAGLAVGGDDGLANRRSELRFGYGFAAFGHRFTSTPEVALGVTDGSRDVGLGWRLGLARGAGALELRLEATRRETASTTAAGAAPEHALGVQATARW